MQDVPSVDELTRLVVETVRRNGFTQDAYIRPSFYKSTRAIGVRLHELENELYIVALPFGNYIDIEKGVRLMTSSWRRNADDALPARGEEAAKRGLDAPPRVPPRPRPPAARRTSILWWRCDTSEGSGGSKYVWPVGDLTHPLNWLKGDLFSHGSLTGWLGDQRSNLFTSRQTVDAVFDTQ